MEGVNRLGPDLKEAWLSGPEIAKQTALALAKGQANPNFSAQISAQEQEPDEGIGLKEYNKRHPAMTPAMIQYYKDTYGSGLKGFGKTWSEHPLGPISDLAMALELGGSYATGLEELDPAILAAREAAIAAGKRAPFSAARTVAGAGSKVGVATSPMALPVAALHLAKIPLNKIPGGAGQIVDSSGNLTPRANASIQAATDGRIPPDRVIAAAPSVVDNMRGKGANTPSAREAIAKSQGVDLSRTSATQRLLPRGSERSVAASNEAGHVAVANRAMELAPPPAKSLGQAWTDAQNASEANYKNAYDEIDNTPGDISDPAFADTINSSIAASTGRGTPFNAILNGGSGAGQNAALHVKALMDDIRSGVAVSPQRLNQLLTFINDEFPSASGAQRTILYQLKNGLNDAISKIRPDQFTGNVADLQRNISAANNAFAQHQQTFFGSHPTDGSIANQVANEAGNAARRGEVNRVTTILGDSIIDPRTGVPAPVASDAISAVNGAGVTPQAHEHVQHVAGSVIGSPSTSGEAAHDITNTWSPIFTPDQQMHFPLLSETKKYLEPPTRKPFGFGDIVAPVARMTSGVAAVHAGLPVGAVDWTLSAIGAPSAERIYETSIRPGVQGILESRGAPTNTGVGTDITNGMAYRALRGTGYGESVLAPTSPSNQTDESQPIEQKMAPSSVHPDEHLPPDMTPVPSSTAESDAHPSLAPSTVNPDEEIHPTIDQPEPRFAGGRVGRATGGGVRNAPKHEYLVNRLLKMAKDAKKVSDRTTEPLLKMPDEHIVRALDVAQQAI